MSISENSHFGDAFSLERRNEGQEKKDFTGRLKWQERKFLQPIPAPRRIFMKYLPRKNFLFHIRRIKVMIE